MSEINKYRCGQACNEQYGLELFRRAMVQHDPLAWEALRQCFKGTMLCWMPAHPQREVAYRLDSKEHYVAQAFARFWQATVSNPGLEFQTLAAVLRYLRATLNGVLLDTLRAYWWPKEARLPEAGERGEPFVEDDREAGAIWEVIQSLLPNEREQRLAYLLFQCGLKPREIVCYCPQEFGEVQEIYRLRRTIVERLLRHADYFR